MLAAILAPSAETRMDQLEQALTSADYEKAKELYELELQRIKEGVGDLKLLHFIPAMAHLSHQQEPGNELLMKNFFEEVIQVLLLAKISKEKQADCYQQIGNFWVEQPCDTQAVACYSQAFDCLKELGSPSAQMMRLGLEQELETLEVKGRYALAKPFILAKIQSGKPTANYEYWQSLKPVLVALKKNDPHGFDDLLKAFLPSLKLYANECLVFNTQEERDRLLPERLEALLDKAIALLAFAPKTSTIINTWALQVLKYGSPLSLTMQKAWDTLVHDPKQYHDHAIDPGSPPSPFAPGAQYRARLKHARELFKQGGKEKQSVLIAQAHYTQAIQALLASMAEDSAAYLGTPPCHYAWIGLGSIARSSLMLNSDLDCALLIAEEKYRTHPYFKALVLAFKQAMDHLGEPWAWSNGTVRCLGLCIDSGDLPRLYEDPEKPDQAWLLNTPQALAQWVLRTLMDQDPLLTTQALAFSLLAPCLLYTPAPSPDVLGAYQAALAKEMSPRRQELLHRLWVSLVKPTLEKKTPEDELKQRYASPLNILCTVVALQEWFLSAQTEENTVFSLKVAPLDLATTLADAWDPDYLNALQEALALVTHARLNQLLLSNREGLDQEHMGAWRFWLAAITSKEWSLEEFLEQRQFHPWIAYLRQSLKIQSQIVPEATIGALAAYLKRRPSSPQDYLEEYEALTKAAYTAVSDEKDVRRMVHVTLKWRQCFYEAVAQELPEQPDILTLLITHPATDGSCLAQLQQTLLWQQQLQTLVMEDHQRLPSK